MKRIALSVCLLWVAMASLAVGRDSYTVIISLDGFRWDYVEAFDTPFLREMATRV